MNTFLDQCNIDLKPNFMASYALAVTLSENRVIINNLNKNTNLLCRDMMYDTSTIIYNTIDTVLKNRKFFIGVKAFIP